MQNLYKKPRPSLRRNGCIYLQIASYKFRFRQTFCTSLSSVEIHFQSYRYFTTFIVFSTSMLVIYLCATFIKRIIHNLICSDALCMRNNVQCTFYIMFSKFMQFNIIFKTIFEYIRKKFRFVHTNTFCEYIKKNMRIASRASCVIYRIAFEVSTNVLYMSVVCGNNFGTRFQQIYRVD